jgi:hypothetical protein
MKKAIVIALALLVAGTYAYANDTNGRDGTGGYGPLGEGYANLRAESDVLIVQYREANTGFGDLIPIYEAALTAAGATVSSIDAVGGDGQVPDPLNPCDYPVTFILTSENWWGPAAAADEPIYITYLEAGGRIYMSGQDYLYGTGYGDGALPAGSFPLACGLGSVTQDQPFGTDYMDVIGHDILDGSYWFVDWTLIFLANPFYPDATVPVAGGFDLAEQVSPETHMGATIYDSGSYRCIFTTLELAGDSLGGFGATIATCYEWLLVDAPVATEATSVGAVKASFK